MALLLLKTLQTTHFFSFLYSSQLRGFLNISYYRIFYTQTHPKSELLQICVHISCMFKLLTYFSKPVFQIL